MTSPLAECAPAYHFSTEIRVRLPETDAMGVVFHGNYFTYLEVGRVDYLTNLGLCEGNRPISEFENVVVSAHLDFNLTLARKESDENPVYYVQYAHARICSVISYAKGEGVVFPEDTSCVELLTEPEEMELIRSLVIFPQLIEGAAESCEPHRLTTYGQQLAGSFHRFYHICRIVSSDRRLSEARLLLAEATRIVLSETLRLLGVSSPDRM